MADKWYAIFDGNPMTSDPVSTGTVIDPDDLQANGLTWVEVAADPTGMVWDRTTLTFKPAPPPPPPSTISAYQFARRFTASEFFNINQSQDHNVQQFMLELQLAPRQQINLLAPEIQQGLQYLASLGLIAPERVAQIGTP
jgi:hypothetical protein